MQKPFIHIHLICILCFALSTVYGQDSNWNQDDWAKHGLELAYAEDFESSRQAFIKASAGAPLSPKNEVRQAMAAMEESYTIYGSGGLDIEVSEALELVDSVEKTHPTLAEAFYEHVLDYLSFYVLCKRGDSIAMEAASFAQEIGDDSLLMKAYLFEARFLECQELESDEAVDYVAKAQAIAIRDERLSGAFQFTLGMTDYYMDRLPQSIERFLEAETEFHNNSDSSGLFELYTSMSGVYEDLQEFDKSHELLERAFPFMNQDNRADLADHYNSLGWNAYRLGDTKKAKEAIQQSIRSYRDLSNCKSIAYPIGNLGLIYMAQNELDSAFKYSTMAVELFQEIKNDGGVAEARNNLGNIELTRGANERARIQFTQGLALAEESGDLFEQANALRGLVEIYETVDSKKALTYLKRLSQIEKSMATKEQAINVARKEAEFKKRLTEDHIEHLEYESKLKTQELEIKNNRLLFVSIGFVLALLFAVLIFLYWLQRKRLMHSLEESNEINERIISMISHDFRGPLNNVRSTLELLQSNDLTQDEFKGLSKELYRQTSNLSLLFDSFIGWAMTQRGGYEPRKDTFFWAEALEEVVEISRPQAASKGISINVSMEKNCEIVTDRMAVSLILRNILSNAIKYSDPKTEIQVTCKQDGKWILTSIKDSGLGMSEDKLAKVLNKGDGSKTGTNREYGTGLGLRMVQRYIKALDGILEVTSEEGVGSEFEVRIPLSYKAPTNLK